MKINRKINLYYFYTEDFERDSGVNQKIVNQILFLNSLGINAQILPLDFKKSLIHKKPFKIFFLNQIYYKIAKALYIRKELHQTIKKINSHDILYYRRTSSLPIFYPLNFFRFFRKCIVVTEHQTKEIQEFLLNHYFIDTIGEFFFGRIIKNQSDAFVGVTDEITHYELSHSKQFFKPHITIGNGINVTLYPIRKQFHNKGKNIHLLFVANVSRWHGIDRLIQGIHIYKNTYEICLHIVGDGKELPNLKRLVVELNLSRQIIFHGFKTGDELDSLFNSCHIAVGSLGIHRKGLTMTSELKAREYCARGIPYIIACGDPDIPDDFHYIFRVPPDESPINIESVINFAQKVCSDPDHPQKMRKYAEENLDWAIKMKKLKGFLETLVDEHQSV